ncbi:transposon Ty3-I Gag-Pol polyprotein [Trichonephila clavipes]|nr:transposon Ty3-I Gag-Pol polyprotein [Trichonephila clavipes]
MLGRRIAARPRPPATVRDLEIALLEEWNSIPQSLIDNLIASMANRIESISEIDYDKVSDAQVDNEELIKLRLKPSLNFKQYPLDSGKLLWCDFSTVNIRPFIPQPLRMHMFQKKSQLGSPCGRGSLVDKVTNLWPASQKFEPSTAEDPSYSGGVVHVKYVETQTSSCWCDVEVRRRGGQLRCRPRHLSMVQNYEPKALV